MTAAFDFVLLNLCDFSDEDYLYYMSLLSEDRKARVERFSSINDRRRSVAGEMLARRMIAQRCGVAPEDIVFRRTERGKPFAVGLPVAFSVSHSGDRVLCAVSDSPVGADIERLRPVNDRLIARVCTENEWSFVMEDGLSGAEKIERFFRVWTGKEAFFKCAGTGITSLRGICIFSEEIRRRMTFFLADGYAVSFFAEAE